MLPPDDWVVDHEVKVPWWYVTLDEESGAPTWPGFLDLDCPLVLQWLLEELLVSLTASGTHLRIFMILCSFHHKTEGQVGHSER